MKTPLKAEVLIKAPIHKVWELWTDPCHIAKWNTISEEWHTPRAKNDLRIGGELFLRMETLDGKEGFDYKCTYNNIIAHTKITHTNADGRKTTIVFAQMGEGVKIVETFEPEQQTPLDIQQQFCLSILMNFKTYVENKY
jgi:uncharacterized protein YndB with AHSA1/START domain